MAKKKTGSDSDIPDRNLRLAMLAALAKGKLIPRLALGKSPRAAADDVDAELAAELGAKPLPDDKLARLKLIEWTDMKFVFALWPQFDGESDEFHIGDLAGLERCTALERLTIHQLHPLHSLEPLASLVKLHELALDFDAQITSLDVVARLTNLRRLRLDGPLSDLRPLGKLERLERLSLVSIRATDVAVLAQLPALQHLHLRWAAGERGPSRDRATAAVEELTRRSVEIDVDWPCGKIEAHRKAIKAAHNRELEERILAAPDDARAYLAYAAWLDAKGDPFGKLIQLDHELVRKKGAKLTEARRVQFVSHREHFLGEFDFDAAHTNLDWRLGFVRGARISEADQARALLRAPATKFMAELDVHLTRDGAEILDVIATSDPAPPLRALEILDDSDHEDPLDASAVLKRYPALERIKIKGKVALGDIDLPMLTSAEITCGCLDLNDKLLSSVLHAKWPMLEELGLFWLEFIPAKIAALLEDTALPLRRLNLGVRWADLFLPVLAAAPIVQRLTWLKISAFEKLTEKGAHDLLAAADRFRHLDVFDFEIGKVSAGAKKELNALRKPARQQRVRGGK